MYTGSYTNNLLIAASSSLLSSRQLGPGWSQSSAVNAPAGPCSRLAFLGAVNSRRLSTYDGREGDMGNSALCPMVKEGAPRL